MAEYSFRYRFQRAPRNAINIGDPRFEIPLGDNRPSLVLSSCDGTTPIKDALQLVFKSDGWDTAEGAAEAGATYFSALAVAFARLRIGADYGERAFGGGFTEAGLAWVEEHTGQRCLNDVYGLTVYETLPAPLFLSSNVKGVRGVPQDHFDAHFAVAVRRPPMLQDRERLALTLFNASFFQDTADARFLLLMMAVEAMIDPADRTDSARAHVERLIAETRDSDQLTANERQSLLGSLKWLLKESISATGRQLAEQNLDGRTYLDRGPAEFFQHCYDLRSRLVHGRAPFPTLEMVNSASAPLEVFVADLLTARWLGFDEAGPAPPG